MRCNHALAGALSANLLILLPALALATRLVCPVGPEDLHTREAMATSAPEIKVRAELQKDGAKWSQTLKPLIQKAIKAAKEQRSEAIQDGIENGCPAGQQYVARILRVPSRASGCDHRVVTRPADNGQTWLQVVAMCGYEWSCCTPEFEAPARGTGSSAGFTLEGPLGASTSAPVTPNLKQKR